MEEEIGEYYRLIKINDEIFISRTFGNKIDGDIDLSNKSLFSNLLQKIDDSVTLPLDKKTIILLIENLRIEKYEDILSVEEASILFIELNRLQTLINAKIPEGLSYINFPKVFSNKDYNYDFPPPVRKVMFDPLVCDICKQKKNSDSEISVEWTDPDNFYGWYYCHNCKDNLMKYLQNTDSKRIWYLRDRKNILIERSALDENNNHIIEEWRIISWLPKKVKDTITNEFKDALYCSNGDLYKYILIDNILKLNP